MTDLLDEVLAGQVPVFALLHRPAATGPGVIEVLSGPLSLPGSLAGIQLPDPDTQHSDTQHSDTQHSDTQHPDSQSGATAESAHCAPRHDVLAILPYRQIAERGFSCPDDGSPLLALTVRRQAALPAQQVLARIADVPIRLSGGAFAPDDAEYADLVRSVVKQEIGEGVGANFVLKRDFTARIEDYTPPAALALFSRLMGRESGAYWTFLVHTGCRTFVGASPERHVSLDGGTAVMNPISGTYRYPPGGASLDGVLRFLTDRKETDELYMVVDEELKMMARVCERGGRVRGPDLKEMARLAHTEYHIEGRSTLDPREILRETMFAPTVTGSPLESACRVISRYEPEGRGYYSGAVALIGRDAHGARTLDSAILIRTADIEASGRVRIGVGATLVRHSDPDSEAAETRAKAEGLLAALRADSATTGGVSSAGSREDQQADAASAAAACSPQRFADHPSVRAALARRNTSIAEFWLTDRATPPRHSRTPMASLAGMSVLVVDAEDTFTAMIAQQLRAMDLRVTVRRFDEPYRREGHDLVVLGPGPGDPRETGHPKIAHLRAAARQLLVERSPFIAVCLSHQVLSLELGFPLLRRDVPNQGVQRRIDLFGVERAAGFYNTFAARAGSDLVECGPVGSVQVSREAETGEVHALRGPGFASMQFHAESILTVDGPQIIASALEHAVRTAGTSARAAIAERIEAVATV